jgi:hypothetical protein
MKIKLQDYSLISNEWIQQSMDFYQSELNSGSELQYVSLAAKISLLEEIKEQLIPSEKLGEEINKVDNEKWYKVFAPKCRNEVGITVRYEIIYIRGDELSEIRDYEILKEYGNRFSIIQELNKEK